MLQPGFANQHVRFPPAPDSAPSFHSIRTYGNDISVFITTVSHRRNSHFLPEMGSKTEVPCVFTRLSNIRPNQLFSIPESVVCKVPLVWKHHVDSCFSEIIHTLRSFPPASNDRSRKVQARSATPFISAATVPIHQTEARMPAHLCYCRNGVEHHRSQVRRLQR